jgi:hypothetical protein
MAEAQRFLSFATPLPFNRANALSVFPKLFIARR